MVTDKAKREEETASRAVRAGALGLPWSQAKESVEENHLIGRGGMSFCTPTCGRTVWRTDTAKAYRSLPDTPGYINFALNERRTSGSQVSLWFGFSDDWIARSESCPRQPWIVVLDGASIHARAERRRSITDEVSCINLAFCATASPLPTERH